MRDTTRECSNPPSSAQEESEVWAVLETLEEEMLSSDPPLVRVTFGVDNDTITLTVDDELSVIDVSGEERSRPADE